jgi:flavin reductase (DIM6/NTAB) family NADH-FMN oxidoreductase RutF
VPFDTQLQKLIMSRFASGVTVVTTGTKERLYGMTASAVASLSLSPPLLLVAVDKGAQMHGYLREHRYFAINILSEEQEAISRRFAQRGPKESADLNLSAAVTGAPVLADALAYADCRLHEILPGGDHDIFIGEIVGGDSREGRPLLYFGGQYRRLPG